MGAVFPDGRVVPGTWDENTIPWDVQYGIEIAAFVGDAPTTACAVSTDRITASAPKGLVQILELFQGKRRLVIARFPYWRGQLTQIPRNDDF